MLFPVMQPAAVQTAQSLPVYCDGAWDFENDAPVFDSEDNPVMVSGLPAVKVWVYNALKTQRRIHEIWTWNYANDMYDLIGRPFTEELKQAEAARYVEDCLKVNPYIKAVTQVEASFESSHLTVSCQVDTIYGEAKINV